MQIDLLRFTGPTPVAHENSSILRQKKTCREAGFINVVIAITDKNQLTDRRIVFAESLTQRPSKMPSAALLA